MDIQAAFVEAWKRHFPRDEVPSLPCFVDNFGKPDKFPAEFKLRNTLQSSIKQVEHLQNELNKQDFVASFLWELTHSGEARPWKSVTNDRVSLCQARDSVSGVVNTRPTDPASNNATHDMDVAVPVYDNGVNTRGDLDHLYKNQSTVTVGDRRLSHPATLPTRGQSGADQSVRSYTELGDSVSSFTGSGLVNSDSFGVAGLENTGSLHGLRRGANKFNTTGGKSLNRASVNVCASSKDLGQTDLQKVNNRHPLQKAWSLDSTGNTGAGGRFSGTFPADRASKSKAPVPAPRPSVKGPTLRPLLSRGSKVGSGGIGSKEVCNVVEMTYCSPAEEAGVAKMSQAKLNSSETVMQEGSGESDLKDAASVTTVPSRNGRPDYVNIDINPSPLIAELSNRKIASDNVSDEIDVGSIGSHLSTLSATDEEKLQLQKRNASRGEVDSAVGSLCDEDINPYDNVVIPGDENLGVMPPSMRRSTDLDVDQSGNKDDAEESSSDDEEPIYYNILLLKQQTSDSMYASVDLQKKQLERQAKRLSKQFSHPTVGSDGTDSTNSQVSSEEDLSAGPGTRSSSVCSDHSVFVYPSGSGARESPAMTPSPTTKDRNPSGKPEEGSWRRTSMARAMQKSTDSEYEELDMLVPVTSDTQKKLQMRKWVVTSILDSEHNYVNMLGVLLQYMRSIQAAASTSQPLISAEDADSIFYCIPDLHEIHSRFIVQLEPKVEAWSSEQEVGEIFKMMALEEYPVASKYLKNYQGALATIQRCSQDNPQFQELTKVIKCTGINESSSLEEILHKPVVRIQRNTLVLHDLIQCTPTSHGDYDILQKTLKITHHFLENLKNPMEVDNADHHYLVKNTLVVERVGNKRKLRHVFLFNNVLVCSKQKIGGGRKLHFEVRWSIPLAELEIDGKSSPQEEKKLEESRRQEINQLQQKIGQLQLELRQEVRRSKMSSDSHTRTWSIRSANRNIDKIKKKLVEQEASLLLASPHLLLKLKGKLKTHTMLLSSDYERNDWIETIKGLKTKVHGSGSLAGVDMNNLVNSLQLPKVDALSSIMDKDNFGIDEEQMFGALNVTIHRVQGLKTPCDVFCNMEVDSYGHFFMKAKTNIISKTTDATWNQDFEIDLDAAQTLRVLCYKQDGDRDVLLGKCALELSKAWLRGDFQEKEIFLNEGLHLTISLRYVSREQTLKRTPSAAKGGLFGVKISTITKREHTRIPLVITSCVGEVERRGLDELGIYRVSGVSSEIQRLKKAFERNSKAAVHLLQEVDIHVIASLLKLYLRELPEALFTDALYSRFVDGMGLADPEAKTTCMVSLIRELPEPNYSIAKFLIEHIVKVSQKQDKNKMSFSNLATVFGPTLLRPAVKDQQPVTMDLFSAGARDAMLQTGILYFFLTVRSSGMEL